MRAVAAVLCALPLLVMTACRPARTYGRDFSAPYVASVPSAWSRSNCADERVVWLENNDVMWVPHREVCHQREVALGHGSFTFRDTNIPTEALIFCSAQRLKDAPSTYCETRRILHWPHAIVSSGATGTLCNGLKAKLSTQEGFVGSYSMIAQSVSATKNGRVYFALYLRTTDKPQDARAAASIYTMCPLRPATTGQ